MSDTTLASNDGKFCPHKLLAAIEVISEVPVTLSLEVTISFCTAHNTDPIYGLNNVAIVAPGVKTPIQEHQWQQSSAHACNMADS